MRNEQKHEHGRNREHRVEVRTYTEEGDIADKDEDSITTGFFTTIIPYQTEIGDKHQYKHGHAVNFGFDRIEPERIGEREEEACNESGSTENNDTEIALTVNLVGKPMDNDFTAPGNGRLCRIEDHRKEIPGEESRNVNCRRGTYHRDVVHAFCDFVDKREYHDNGTGQEHEEGSSRGMRNTECIGTCYKFAAIPEAHCRRHGQRVYDKCNQTGNAGKHMFHPFFLMHEIYLPYSIS